MSLNSIEDRLAADGYLGTEPVLFYRAAERPFGCFSNFSPHGFALPHPFAPSGALWHYSTGEHRFQAMKATAAAEHDRIALAGNAYQAKRAGGTTDLRPGWDDGLSYLVMLEVVTAKAAANSSIVRTLLDTGLRPIYEDSPVDDIWGVRFQRSYTGKNLLGKAWMQARRGFQAGAASVVR